MDSSKFGHLKALLVVKIIDYYCAWSQRHFGIKTSHMVKEKQLLNAFTLQYWLSVFWSL